MKRQSQFGFAFIEVAMVTVMIMLISSFTVPQLAASMELYRLDIAASMIQGKLVEARLNATKRNRQVQLLFDRPAGSFEIETTDSGGNTINVGSQEFLPSGVTFEISATPAQVTFSSLGRPTGPCIITLNGARTGEVKTLTMSGVGQIEVN